MLIEKINNVSNPYINNQSLYGKRNISFKSNSAGDSFESRKQEEIKAAEELWKILNRRHMQKHPVHIEFKKAESIEDALQFGQQTLGITEYKGFTEKDLDVINWINEGLVKVNNASKGKAVMPLEILFKKRKGADAAMSDFGSLIINKQQVNIVKKLFLFMSKFFSDWPVTIKEIRQFLGKRANTPPRYISVFSDISHEMGHWQHQNNIGFDLYESLHSEAELHKRWKDLPEYLNPKFKKLEEGAKLRKLFENSLDTAAKVSKYAKSSPHEFAAECYAQMVDGIELDDDVKELYKKLGGAEL